MLNKYQYILAHVREIETDRLAVHDVFVRILRFRGVPYYRFRVYEQRNNDRQLDLFPFGWDR